MQLFDVYPLQDINCGSGKRRMGVGRAGPQIPRYVRRTRAVISIGHTHPHYVETTDCTVEKNRVLLQFGQNTDPAGAWLKNWALSPGSLIINCFCAIRGPKPTKMHSSWPVSYRAKKIVAFQKSISRAHFFSRRCHRQPQNRGPDKPNGQCDFSTLQRHCCTRQLLYRARP